MIYRFPLRDVKDMLLNQIGNNFFKSIDDERLITKHMERTLERLERNISANENKYYWRLNAAGEREAYFDPLHTCHWMLFLYLTANTKHYFPRGKRQSHCSTYCLRQDLRSNEDGFGLRLVLRS